MVTKHISLYRKWRPQTFGEVIGQHHVTNTLQNALQSGRVVHAYMFCGPRGTGKTSTARILAKAINCVEGPTATPCNTCEACVSISEGTALDVIEIDAASNRKIDEIRDLLDKIPYTPTALRTKVYIIDEVHQLTPEASSALLKTLEEPPSHVVFVLATTEPHKILPTIVSRCQRFDFQMVSTQEISGLLEHIASREAIDIEAEAVSIIAEHAHGSVRDAIGVMDQISNLSGETVTSTELAELLGEVEVDLVFDMVDLIMERDTPGALALVGTMVDSGKDPRRFVEALISHLRSLFLIQNARNPREIVEATDAHFDRLAEQAGGLKRYEVMRLIERLGETHREMRWSESPRLALECALVRATRTDVDVSVEGLLFRMEELEKKVEALLGDGGAAPIAPRAEAAAGEKPGKVVRAPKGKGEKKASADKVAVEAAVEAEPDTEEAEAKGGVPEREQVAPGSIDRDKARRAWAAVLAELKKQGQIRLYALLTKARIQEIRGRRVILGFPADASFQLDVLKDSGDLGRIEETWSRIMGEEVEVGLENAKESGPVRKKPAARSGAPTHSARAGKPAPPAGKKLPEEKKAEEEDVEPAADEDVGGPDPAEGGASASANSKEVVEILKDRFDGEIISREEERKE